MKEEIKLPFENIQLTFEGLPKTEMMSFKKNKTPSTAFPGFEKGYSAFGFNNGCFSFGDVIEHVLNKIGPSHALISTWVASQAASEKVVDFLQNRRLLSARFLLDRMFTETRRTVYDFIVRHFGVESIRTTRTHSKFCALYNDDWFVVIETSANLNKNVRLESFRITENKEYCLFFKNLFDQFFNVIGSKENGKLSSAQKLEEIKEVEIGFDKAEYKDDFEEIKIDNFDLEEIKEY